MGFYLLKNQFISAAMGKFRATLHLFEDILLNTTPHKRLNLAEEHTAKAELIMTVPLAKYKIY